MRRDKINGKEKTMTIDYTLPKGHDEVCWMGLVVTRKGDQPRCKHRLLVPFAMSPYITQHERKYIDDWTQAFGKFCEDYAKTHKVKGLHYETV